MKRLIEERTFENQTVQKDREKVVCVSLQRKMENQVKMTLSLATRRLRRGQLNKFIFPFRFRLVVLVYYFQFFFFVFRFR